MVTADVKVLGTAEVVGAAEQVAPVVPVQWPARLARLPLVAPLRERDFSLLWAGNAVSLAGDNFQSVALAVLVLDLTHSAAALGTILMLQAVPRAVFMLVGGVIADRFRPRLSLLAANTLQGVFVAGLVAAMLGGHLAPWHLYVYALCSGTALAFSIPAADALLPQLVPAALLRSANALSTLNFNLAIALVPPLAGVLVERTGTLSSFVLNAVSFFVVAVAVLLIREPRVRRARSASSPFASLMEGVRVARRDRPVWIAILTATVYSLGFGGAFFVGVPALAKLALNGGSAGVGILYGAAGVGSVLGILAVGTARAIPRQGLAGGLTLVALGVPLALAALAPSIWVAALLLLVCRFFHGVCANIFITFVQLRAPAEARGRVMALFKLGVMGLAPLSLGIGGAVGDAFGPRFALGAGGVVICLSGAYALWQRDFRTAE